MAQSNIAAASGGKPHSGSREKAPAAGGRDAGKTADKDKKLAKKHEQDRKDDAALDEALEESFPASDPPAASQPTGPGPAGDPATKP